MCEADMHGPHVSLRTEDLLHFPIPLWS